MDMMLDFPHPTLFDHTRLTTLSNQCNDLVLLDLQIQLLEHLHVFLGRVCKPDPPELYLCDLLLVCGGHPLRTIGWRV